MTIGFPGAPEGSDSRGLAALINRMNLGKLNCTGTVVLRADEPGTTVVDSRITAGSFIGLAALTAEAAAELAAGTLFVSSRANGRFELTHASSPEIDRRFAYVVIG